MINCVIYARFSSDNQRDESIDAQVRACKEYCKRNGMVLVKIYSDEARSATTDQRPEFQQMIRDAESGEWQAVIVHKLDRFSRDRYDSAYYKRQLKINGIRLYSVLENLDDSPESIILESVLEGMAEYYSKNLARETMKGLKENAYKCVHTGGRPPYGYIVGPDRKLAVNPVKATAVRLLFELYTNGSEYGEIIDTLYKRGFKARSGGKFSKITLHDMLINEKYAGIFVYNKTKSGIGGRRNGHSYKDDADVIRIPGGCPAIIDPDTWANAQALMKKNRQHGAVSSYRAKRRVYLLSGLVHCGQCGATMSGAVKTGGRAGGHYPYYVCHKRGNKHDCTTKAINADYLEREVLKHLYDTLFVPAAMERLAEKMCQIINDADAGSNIRLEELKAQIAGLDKKIGNLTMAIADGLYSPVIKDQLMGLEDQRAFISRQITAIESSNPQAISKAEIMKILMVAKTNLISGDLKKQKKAIRTYVKDIAINDEKALIKPIIPGP
ncbi:recombinase family protein [Eubacterium aggregans]|uniref:recombinase family protein n=1 Tax=Eubacterium aggregans TaxID=81409 RepID=UPI003F410F34